MLKIMAKISQILSFIAFACALSQNAASITVDKVRPEGSKRIYQFMLKDKKFGQLESVAGGKSSLDGIEGFRFDEDLKLDMTPLGNQYKLSIKNRHYIGASGQYIGDEMKITMNDQEQGLYLSHKDNTVSGYFERDKSRQAITIPMESRFFSLDNYMIDQYEIFLAMRNLKVGDTIRDSIFIPQTMTTAPVQVVIEAISMIRYGNMSDSALVCHFIEPTDQIAYITKDRKLVRLVQPSQNITVELYENPLDKYKMQSKPVSIGDIVWRMPLYAVYLIFGLAFSFPFIKKNYRKAAVYIAIVIGAISYNLLKITHVPLQEWYISAYVLPGIKAGGSLYFYAIFSALFAGLIQELVIFVPIILLYFILKDIAKTPMLIGIFSALGFGLYEAGALTGGAFQSGTIGIISWTVFERVLTILFHMTAGALVGFSLNRGTKFIGLSLLAAIVIHAVASYLVVFVQRKIIDFAIFEIVVALIYLFFLLGVYLWIKRNRVRKTAKSD